MSRSCKAGFVALLLTFTVAWATPSVAISVSSGDYNGDGTVDDLDYAVWNASYGNAPFAALTVGLSADGNGDGNVDAIDYAIWRQSVGDLVLVPVVPAQPLSIDVVGTPNAGNIDWTVYVTPDTTMLPGAVGLEMSYEMAAGTLITSSVMEDTRFVEPVALGVQPGNDPYAGGVVYGPQTYTPTTSVLGTGTVDAIFAPQGSTLLSTPGPFAAFRFTTLGPANTVTFGGVAAQGGQLFTLPTLSVTVVPEPSALAIVTLAGLGLLGYVRRRW